MPSSVAWTRQLSSLVAQKEWDDFSERVAPKILRNLMQMEDDGVPGLVHAILQQPVICQAFGTHLATCAETSPPPAAAVPEALSHPLAVPPVWYQDVVPGPSEGVERSLPPNAQWDHLN